MSDKVVIQPEILSSTTKKIISTPGVQFYYFNDITFFIACIEFAYTGLALEIYPKAFCLKSKNFISFKKYNLIHLLVQSWI